jgi:Mg2+ and Co2+ transporter CorA
MKLIIVKSVFGMNITQITGSAEDSPLWAYFVLACSLMAATFGGWYVWSKSLSRRQLKMKKTEAQKV